MSTGRFGSEFVENRRLGLESALNKIVSHPMLVGDPDLRLFLESDTFHIDVRALPLSRCRVLSLTHGTDARRSSSARSTRRPSTRASSPTSAAVSRAPSSPSSTMCVSFPPSPPVPEGRADAEVPAVLRPAPSAARGLRDAAAHTPRLARQSRKGSTRASGLGRRAAVGLPRARPVRPVVLAAQAPRRGGVGAEEAVRPRRGAGRRRGEDRRPDDGRRDLRPAVHECEGASAPSLLSPPFPQALRLLAPMG